MKITNITKALPLCEAGLVIFSSKLGECWFAIRLPQTEHVLHDKAYHSDAKPAAEAHEDGFATGFYELDNVGVKTNGTHG